MWDDDWTVLTADGSRVRPVRAHPGRHRSHGAEILTLP